MTKYITPIQRFWSKVDKKGEDECWLWRGTRNNDGYGQFWDGIFISCHRFSYFLIHGKIPEGMYILHKCDNRACVNPKHLFLGTQQDNMKDMSIKGRGSDIIQIGEVNHNSKLRDSDIMKIRELYKTGKHSQNKIANLFSVSQSTISFIICNKTWVTQD